MDPSRRLLLTPDGKYSEEFTLVLASGVPAPGEGDSSEMSDFFFIYKTVKASPAPDPSTPPPTHQPRPRPVGPAPVFTLAPSDRR